MSLGRAGLQNQRPVAANLLHHHLLPHRIPFNLTLPVGILTEGLFEIVPFKPHRRADLHLCAGAAMQVNHNQKLGAAQR